MIKSTFSLGFWWILQLQKTNKLVEDNRKIQQCIYDNILLSGHVLMKMLLKLIIFRIRNSFIDFEFKIKICAYLKHFYCYLIYLIVLSSKYLSRFFPNKANNNFLFDPSLSTAKNLLNISICKWIHFQMDTFSSINILMHKLRTKSHYFFFFASSSCTIKAWKLPLS